MDIHLLSYYAGIIIVFFSHIFMLFNKPSNMMLQHSVVNIFAAIFIAYYFMHKEGFIQF